MTEPLPIVDVKSAAMRLMAEIILFGDRPDYCHPPSVEVAFAVLEKDLNIPKDWKYKHYDDWYAADEAERGSK